jgi:hypothetical protein
MSVIVCVLDVRSHPTHVTIPDRISFFAFKTKDHSKEHPDFDPLENVLRFSYFSFVLVALTN